MIVASRDETPGKQKPDELVSAEEIKTYGLYRANLPAVKLGEPQVLGLRRRYDVSPNWNELLAPLAPSLAGFLDWHKGPQGAVAKATA